MLNCVPIDDSRGERASPRGRRTLRTLAVLFLLFFLGSMELSCITGDSGSIIVDIPDADVLVPLLPVESSSEDIEPDPELEPLGE